MKLYLNKPSPYARLALVVAHEKNLAGRLELEWVDPWKSPAELAAVNPFSRVPALVTDDGIAIVDSACICDYFDQLGGGRALVHGGVQERSRILRRVGLAKTLTDAAFGTVVARRFGSPGTAPALAERWVGAAGIALKAMEGDDAFSTMREDPDLGDLELAVALGYIDFRLEEIGWRKNGPKLRAWYEAIATRVSMRATPHE